MPTNIETLNKRAWDGTGAGIGHGAATAGLIAKLNEIIDRLNEQTGAGGTQADLIFDASAVAEVVSGVAALTQGVHRLGGEGNNPDTVTSFTGLTAGEVFLVSPDLAADPITLQHGEGANLITCPFSKDIVLTELTDWALGYYNGTQSVILAFSTKAANAGGAGAIIGLLSALATTDKTNVVAALNEVRGLFGTLNAATANGTGVALTVSAEGAVKRIRLTFTAVAIALVDNAGVVAFGSLKVLDFPEGYITIIGAVANLALTKSSAGVSDAWNGDFGLGTVAADNTNSLATNEQNIIASTATPLAVGGATTAKGGTTSPPASFNGSSTAVDLYLNFLVDDADHDVTATPCNIIVNGTIDIIYALLGDV